MMNPIFGHVVLIPEENLCEFFQIFRSNRSQHVLFYSSQLSRKLLIVEVKCRNKKVAVLCQVFNEIFSTIASTLKS